MLVSLMLNRYELICNQEESVDIILTTVARIPSPL